MYTFFLVLPLSAFWDDHTFEENVNDEMGEVCVSKEYRLI